MRKEPTTVISARMRSTIIITILVRRDRMDRPPFENVVAGVTHRSNIPRRGG